MCVRLGLLDPEITKISEFLKGESGVTGIVTCYVPILTAPINFGELPVYTE